MQVLQDKSEIFIMDRKEEKKENFRQRKWCVKGNWGRKVKDTHKGLNLYLNLTRYWLHKLSDVRKYHSHSFYKEANCPHQDTLSNLVEQAFLAVVQAPLVIPASHIECLGLSPIYAFDFSLMTMYPIYGKGRMMMA